MEPINKLKSSLKKCSGFTLLEVIVSIAILGTAIALIAQIMSGGLRSALLSRKYTRGVIYAEAKMKEISLNNAIMVGSESGHFADDESYRWEREVSTYEREDEETVEETAVGTYKIRVTIFFSIGEKEKRIDLVSLRTFVANEDI